MPSSLEDAILLPQGSHTADVRHGERHPELVFIARPKGKAPVLHAHAAAIGVVGDLALSELQDALTVIVERAESVVPAAPVIATVRNLPTQLIRAGKRQDGIALQEVIA